MKEKKKYNTNMKTIKLSTKKRNIAIVNSKKTVKSMLGSPKLVKLTSLDDKQIGQLAEITSDINVMRTIGSGGTWDIQAIRSFIKDEQVEENKSADSVRKYYTYILVDSNKNVIGYISARKNQKLINLTPLLSSGKYDVLLRFFISAKYQGRGYGKLIVKLFLDKYTRIIRKQGIKKHVNIISDCDPANTASAATALSNKFKLYMKNLKYPGNIHVDRYLYKL